MTAHVRRVDGRLGLAIRRASLSGRSLVTYARDHLVVRTPSRPDFRDGNTIDLERPPRTDELPAWIDRYVRTVGTLGATHVRLRWETPAEPDAPAIVPVADPAVVAGCGALDLDLQPLTALLLDHLGEPPDAPTQLVAVAPPAEEAGGVVDRRWHAATVLYRYEEGDTPDDWRDTDPDFLTWLVDVQRELALAGRAQVWLAMRHGAPVGRLTLAHDKQGLAVIEDVVVHPAHRGLGIASRLTHEAVRRHLDDRPGDRVGVVAEPGGTAERLYRRLGFSPHATTWQADGEQVPGGQGGAGRSL